MDYLIQNTTPAPLNIPVVRIKEGKPVSEGHIVLEGNNAVTKISDEIYERFIVKNAFYRQRVEKGELIVLNNQSGAVIDEKVTAGIQGRELNYARYVNFVRQIESTGGLSEPRLRPFLDSEGMPMLEICRKNLGSNVDPQVLDEFRSRYLVEKANGMHEQTLVLPGGAKMTAGAVNTKVVEEKIEIEQEEKTVDPIAELDELTLEQLKERADELGVQYAEDITFKRLKARVVKAMKATEE